MSPHKVAQIIADTRDAHADGADRFWILTARADALMAKHADNYVPPMRFGAAGETVPEYEAELARWKVALGVSP